MPKPGAAGASLPDLFTIIGMRIDEILKRRRALVLG